MATFIVNGPFVVPTKRERTGAKSIDEGGLKELFRKQPTLKDYGCFVFSVRASRGSKPLYVGKAVEATIEKEAFSHRNRNLVLGALNKRGAGTLLVWTVTRKKGERGPKPETQIADIEADLTKLASIENPHLLNTQNIHRKKSWSIEGVIQPTRGQRRTEATDFRKMIGLAVKKNKTARKKSTMERELYTLNQHADELCQHAEELCQWIAENSGSADSPQSIDRKAVEERFPDEGAVYFAVRELATLKFVVLVRDSSEAWISLRATKKLFEHCEEQRGKPT